MPKITINYSPLEHRLALSSPSSRFRKLNLSTALLNKSWPSFPNAVDCAVWLIVDEGSVIWNNDRSDSHNMHTHEGKGKRKPCFQKTLPGQRLPELHESYVWSQDNILALILWILGFLLLFHSLTHWFLPLNKHLNIYLKKYHYTLSFSKSLKCIWI